MRIFNFNETAYKTPYFTAADKICLWFTGSEITDIISVANYILCGRQGVMDTRCSWAGTDPLYVKYHDDEWGVPVHDDRTLFEFLILEGAQAGLSWFTILKKRENYRKAFDNFDALKVALYNEEKIAELLRDTGLVRNRLKIGAAVENARHFIEIQKEFGSFDRYVWAFVGGKSRLNRWETVEQVPAFTEESDMLSSDLRKRGFKFVGSTICYSFMQAVGMVNDHVMGCHRYNEINS
jgi:DNA-3-methyladenine glycosylase I